MKTFISLPVRENSCWRLGQNWASCWIFASFDVIFRRSFIFQAVCIWQMGALSTDLKVSVWKAEVLSSELNDDVFLLKESSADLIHFVNSLHDSAKDVAFWPIVCMRSFCCFNPFIVFCLKLWNSLGFWSFCRSIPVNFIASIASAAVIISSCSWTDSATRSLCLLWHSWRRSRLVAMFSFTLIRRLVNGITKWLSWFLVQQSSQIAVEQLLFLQNIFSTFLWMAHSFCSSALVGLFVDAWKKL